MQPSTCNKVGPLLNKVHSAVLNELRCLSGEIMISFDAEHGAVHYNTAKKDHLRVSIIGTKEGDIFYVQSLRM